MQMIRLSKYTRVAVITTLILMFALQRWRFQSLFDRNVALMIFTGLCAVWMLKYGFEGVADMKQIKGKPNNHQKAAYYISVGQILSGILVLLYFVFFFLFQSSWRIFTYAESLGLPVTPR